MIFRSLLQNISTFIMKSVPAMLWDMIFLIIMSRDTGMANLRRKIPSGIVFYLKHQNSYRRKCPLLKTNLKKYLRNCPLLKKKIKKKHFFCPLLLTGTKGKYIPRKMQSYSLISPRKVYYFS